MKKFGNVFYGRMKLEGESGRGGRVFSYKDPLNSNFIGGGGGRRRLYIVKRNNFLSFGGDTILCFPSTARHGLKVYQLLVLYRFEDIAVSMVSDGQKPFLEHIKIRLISN